MNYTLRKYQEDAVREGVHHFDNYQKPFVLILPTGSGKSLVIADICHKLNEPVLILQPSKEILAQNYAKLLSYGVQDIGIYSASFDSKEVEKYTYATIGSIYKKPELFKHFKYVIIDEAHLVNPKNKRGMYNKFFEAIGCTNICGLTATPYRLVQRFFHEGSDLFYTAQLVTINRIPPFFFKKFAYNVSIKELQAQGYLAQIEYKYFSDFDVHDVKINTTGGDYDSESIERFWSDSRLKKLAQIIGEVDKEANHNLIFCSSIRQATRCTEMLREMGHMAAFITSEHSPSERDSLIERFRNGQIKHMCNVGVLTTGFDFPELDTITLARPTISLALLYQMIGRGMRPHPTKKVCRVIDITENTKKLGRIETIEVGKEKGGFRSVVNTEVGEVTQKPLFRFKVKNEDRKAALQTTKED